VEGCHVRKVELGWRSTSHVREEEHLRGRGGEGGGGGDGGGGEGGGSGDGGSGNGGGGEGCGGKGGGATAVAEGGGVEGGGERRGERRGEEYMMYMFARVPASESTLQVLNQARNVGIGARRLGAVRRDASTDRKGVSHQGFYLDEFLPA